MKLLKKEINNKRNQTDTTDILKQRNTKGPQELGHVLINRGLNL